MAGTFVEAGLSLKLDGINDYISGLFNVDQGHEEAAASGDKLGDIFIKIAGFMSPIPVLLDQISQETKDGLGFGAVASAASTLNASILSLTTHAQELAAIFTKLIAAPIKLQLELPNLESFETLARNAQFLDVLSEQFGKVSTSIDSSNIIEKFEAINKVLRANALTGVANDLQIGLQKITKALTAFAQIPDFSKVSPRLTSLLNNVQKFATITGSTSVRGIEQLAAGIPKLVNSFRSLAQTKSLDEFLKRMKELLPFLEQLGRISFGTFASEIPKVASGLDLLFKTFKEFSTGKGISQLPTVLKALADELPKLFVAFSATSIDDISKFTTALENISKSFRNFGLAVKNFTASGTSLQDMVTKIKEFAESLEQNIEIGNFVTAISAIAEALAKFARALASFSRNKNVGDVSARFLEIRNGILQLATLNLDSIAKNLTKITTPLRDLAEVLRTISKAKELGAFGTQLSLLNSALNGTNGPLNSFKGLIGSLSPIFNPIVSAMKAFGSALVQLPLKFVVLNLQIFRSIFINLPIAVVTGLFRAFVGVIELFVSALRILVGLLGTLFNAFVKIVTLGGSLTQVFSFLGFGKTNQNLQNINKSLNTTATEFQQTGQAAQQTNEALERTGAVVQKSSGIFRSFATGLGSAAAGLTAAGIATGALNAVKIVLFGNSVQGLIKRVLALTVAFKTLQLAGGLLNGIFNRVQFALQSTLGVALQSTIAYEKLALSVQSLSARELVNAGQFKSLEEALPAAAEKAQDLIARLETLAIISPFSTQDIQGAFTLAQAYGFTAEAAFTLTEQIVDFLSATGQSSQVGETIARVAGQISSLTKLTTGDLNQLAQAGINLRTELSNVTGLPIEELMTTISDGGISAEVALKALNNVLGEFDGSAERASQSVGGLLASLTDLGRSSLRQVFAGVFEALTPFAGELVASLQTAEIKTQLIGISNIIRDTTLSIINGLIGPISFIISAFNAIPEPIKRFAGELLKLLAIMGTATIAFTLLQSAATIAFAAIALFLNPVALAIAAFTGLGIVIYQNIDAISAFGSAAFTFIQPAIDLIINGFARISGTLLNIAIGFANLVGSIITFGQSLASASSIERFNQILSNTVEVLGIVVDGFFDGFSAIQNIVGTSVNNLLSFFGTTLDELVTFGANVVNSFAEGIISTLSVVADALSQLGSILSYWLSPGSPPRIAPDIDKWGASTAQEYLDGFSEADFNAVDDFSKTLESLLGNLDVDTSQIDFTDITEQFVTALGQLNNTGQIDTSFATNIAQETGVASGEVEKLVTKYLEVQKATNNARKATEQFDAALKQANDTASGIESQEQARIEEKRLKNLQKRLESRFLTEEQRTSTITEIEKIQAQQRIRDLEKQKNAAEDTLTTAEGSLATEQAKIDLAQKLTKEKQQTAALESQIGGIDSSDAVKKSTTAVDKAADANFKYQLALTDTAGQIELYKQRLTELEPGTAEYFDTLTKITQLEEKRAKELEKANKDKGGQLTLDDLIDPGVPPGLKTLTKQLTSPLTEFKKQIDVVKLRFDTFFGGIKTQFDEFKKRLESVGLTSERLKNIAIGLGVAFATVTFGKPIVIILSLLATLSAPLLAVGAAIAGVAGAIFLLSGGSVNSAITNIQNLIGAFIDFGKISLNVGKGFTSGQNIFESLINFDTSNLAQSLGAIAGSVVKLFIDFQKNILQAVGKIVTGTNPIDAILSSFLNADYAGTGAKIRQNILQFFKNITDFIVNIPTLFQAELSKTDGGIAGILQAVINTGLAILKDNPIRDAINKFLNFDLSNIKINIGGFEFQGGEKLGSGLAALLNDIFNTSNFNFLANIDFSTPLSVIISTFDLIKERVGLALSSIKEQLISFIPPEVLSTLNIIETAFGVLSQAVEGFQQNFQNEETAAALQNLARAAGFAAQQFLKVTAFIIGGVTALATVLGVGILPELPRIITNISNALAGVFDFIGNTFQTLIDFILEGNFSLSAFGELIGTIFGDLFSTVSGIFTAFSNLNNVFSKAIENIIRFASVKFGFDAEAVIEQLSGLLGILDNLGGVILAVFGGFALKAIIGFGKQFSLLRLLFLPLTKSIQLLTSPFKLLFTIITRVFKASGELSRGIRALDKTNKSAFQGIKSLGDILKRVVAVLTGKDIFGPLVKPAKQVATAVNGVASATTKVTTAVTKAPGAFSKLLGIFGKFIRPLSLLIGGFLAFQALVDSGFGENLSNFFSGLSLGSLDFSVLTEGLSIDSILNVIGPIFLGSFSKLAPFIINGIKGINIASIGAAFKTLFSGLNLETIFTVFTTFPGLILKFFNPSIFGKIITLFTSTFSKIGGLIQPLIGIVLRFGAIFLRLVPFITNPIGLIIGAVSLFAIAWYNNWFGIQEIVKTAFDNLLKILPQIPGIVGNLITTLVDGLIAGAKFLYNIAEPYATAFFSWITNAIIAAPQFIFDLISNITTALITGAAQLATIAAPYVTAFFGWVVEVIAAIPAKIQEITSEIVRLLILGGLGFIGLSISLATQFFGWVTEVIALIPAKISEIVTGIVNAIQSIFNPAFSEQATITGQGFLLSLVTFFSGATGFLLTIAQSIINGIKIGIDEALKDPQVATALQPLIDNFNTFINGPTGVVTLFNTIVTTITDVASMITTVVWTNPFEQLTAFINGEQGILTTIALIFAAFDELILKLTGINIPNPFIALAQFIEGPDGLISKFTLFKSEIDTFIASLTSIEIPNPFDDLAAIFSGETSISVGIQNILGEFSTFVEQIGALEIPNPFALIADVLIGENSLTTLLANLSVEFTNFASSVTGLEIPNPFAPLLLVLTGEGSIESAINSIGTQITNFVLSLDQVFPNPFAPISLVLEGIKALFPGVSAEITAFQEFLNGISFVDIFLIIVNSGKALVGLIQPLIDGFGQLSEFFANFTIPNPFAGLEIPAPVKAALEFAGISLGEETATNIATGFQEAAQTQLNNINVGVTNSSDTLAQASTAGNEIGTNVAEGVKQGVTTATEDQGFFGGITSGIQGAWNSVWGIQSPSTVAEQTMGLPIGQGILSGILLAFAESNEQFTATFAFLITKFTELSTNIVTIFTAMIGILTISYTAFLATLRNATTLFNEQDLAQRQTFHDNTEALIVDFFAKVVDLTTEFLLVLITAFTEFVDEVIRQITRMVDTFIAEIKRLSASVISELNAFLSAVRSTMSEFATIMENAARAGVDAFITYIQENFVDRVTAAFEGAFGQLVADLTAEDGIMQNGGEAIGEAFIEGVITGINNADDDLFQVIRDLAAQIIAELRAGLQISSPSRLANIKVGQPTVQGILQGVLSGEKGLYRGVNSMIGGMFRGNYGNKANRLASSLTNPLTKAFDKLMSNDLAQNISLGYNNTLDNLSQSLQASVDMSNSSLPDYFKGLQGLAVPASNSFITNRYATSTNEQHYHMHMTVTPERATRVRKNFKVAEFLKIRN